LKRQQAVKQYAKMFFNTVELEKMPTALDELVAVNGLMEKSPEFKGLLGNPLFTAQDREKAMKYVSGAMGVSEATMKFILYLAEKMVISQLAQLIQIITALYLEKKKRAKATVLLPVATDRKYDDILKPSLKRLTGRDVDLEYIVDPSLIGGVVIKVGSTLYDSSLRGQLRLLKDDLIKG
jgi:F-type H+-transporting ATPase subunit delta